MNTPHRTLSRITAGAFTVLLTISTAGCGISPADHTESARSATLSQTPSTTSTHQEGAPYPADMEHLDEILSIGQGHNLPEGAEVTSVSPATNFAASYPGGWGYIIAFTATDPAIRTYVTNNTLHDGSLLENYPTVTQSIGDLEDVNINAISNPWVTRSKGAILLLERPLGRGWLIIKGAPR